MTTTEMTLLQIVALSLPALAILMQAMLRLQSDDSEGGMRLYSEFRILEFSFVLLVFSAGAFAFQIAQSVSSTIIFIGLISMSLAFILVIPAMTFSLRRGMTEMTPEKAVVRTWKKNSRYKTRILIAVLVIGLVLGLILSQTTLGGIPPYVIVSIVAISVSSAIIIYTNSIIDKRAEEQEIKEWEANVASILSRVITRIESQEIDDEPTLSNAGFRGTLFRHLEELSDEFNNYPGELSDEVADQFRHIHLRYTELQELYSEYSELTEEINQLRERISEIKQGPGGDVQDRIAQVQEQIEQAEAQGRKARLREEQEELLEKKSSYRNEIKQYREQISTIEDSKHDIEEEMQSLIKDIEDTCRELSSKIN